MSIPTEHELREWLVRRVGQAIDAASPFPATLWSVGPEGSISHKAITPTPLLAAEAASAALDAAEDIIDYIVQHFGPLRAPGSKEAK